MKTTDLLIEELAIGCKIGVENSSLSEKEKESVKFGIDFAKELLKDATKTPEEKLNECAKLCGIKKIILKQYCSKIFTYIFFDIQGDDKIRFINMLGLKPLSQIEVMIIENCLKNIELEIVAKKEICFD